MQDLTKKILDKLPSSWEQITLRDYIKLSDIEIVQSDEADGLFVGITNDIKVISVLTETSVERIEQLPMPDINMLREKIQFIALEPVVDTSAKNTFKSIEEITYSDFVTTNEIIYKEPFKKMHKIIQCFSKSKITDDEALNMSMPQVMTAFFLQRKGLKKSLNALKRSFRKEIVSLIRREKMTA